jgi:hypothetical protein
MRILWCAFLFAGIAFSRTEFWAPLQPPQAHYSADVRYDPATALLEGTETIRFRNGTSRPIGRVQLQWLSDSLTVEVEGKPLRRWPVDRRTYLFEFPSDLAPGTEIALAVRFSAPFPLNASDGSAITSFVTPRLWWGFGTLDDYEVRLTAPEGYVWGASGRYDAAKRAYVNERARAFGAFLGKGYRTAEADAGDVKVRAIFTDEGRPCAEFLLATATDVIQFYRERFGVYPHRSLTIAPGMDYPAGGYPPATSLVVVHGQTRFAEKPRDWWRWITAHEIGHMYWGDHVLSDGEDSLSWLMLGLGIRADQEYRRARGVTQGNLEANYGSGVSQGRDTMMDITAEQVDAIDWGFGSIVAHGKSIAMLNAVESVIGRPAFEAVYRRLIREHGGQRLGWRDFQRLIERETGEDLGWFFEQWVRSSAAAYYRVGPTTPTTAQIERAGELRMPLAVVARFEDGTEQHARTERLLTVDELQFQTGSRLKEVALDPDHALVMVDAPPLPRPLVSRIQGMKWGGPADAPLALYREASAPKLDDPSARFRLALLLYDSRHYAEALDLLKDDGRAWSLIWRGHLLDLLGRRAEAVAAYQTALALPGEIKFSHTQWSMTIDRKWVEDRLKTPFDRKP